MTENDINNEFKQLQALQQEAMNNVNTIAQSMQDILNGTLDNTVTVISKISELAAKLGKEENN